MLNLLKKTLHEIRIPYEKKIPYLFLLLVTEGSGGKETQEFLWCDAAISLYKLTKYWVPTPRSVEFPLPATASFSILAEIYHSKLNLMQPSTGAIWA